MGLALRSAELAVQILLTDSANLASLRYHYKKLWKIRRPACRFAAKMLSSPTLAGPTIELLANNDALAAFALRCLGKSIA